MKIVLIGFMCSGKSSVGRLLAKRLGWPFFDTDELIEKQVKAPIHKIIQTQGEPAFRELERMAVRLVALSNDAVIATGGGVFLDADNRKELSQNSQLIWLRLTPETVLKRAGNFKSRPLIDASRPLESIQARMKERDAVYAQANHTLDVDQMDQAAIVERIMEVVPGSSQ